MKKTLSILMRILVFPFIFCIFVIVSIFGNLKLSYLFLMYGGEFIAYAKDSRKTIYDIYEQLKNNNYGMGN